MKQVTRLTKKTPLFRAIDSETVRLLLKFGADPTITANYLDSSNKICNMTAIQHLMKYNVDALWAWPLSKIFPVMAFSGPICYEKQVSNDNI